MSLIGKIKEKCGILRKRLELNLLTARVKLCDTSGEGFIDTAVKIIIGVVVGALVLAGIVLMWGDTIMPRLNQEINKMFGS